MGDTDALSVSSHATSSLNSKHGIWKDNNLLTHESIKQERIVVTWPGTSKTFKPIEKISEVPWTVKMLTYFDREGLHCFTSCQSIMWKAVSKLLSVVCVAGAAQGKSLGKNCLNKIINR